MSTSPPPPRLWQRSLASASALAYDGDDGLRPRIRTTASAAVVEFSASSRRTARQRFRRRVAGLLGLRASGGGQPRRPQLPVQAVRAASSRTDVTTTLRRALPSRLLSCGATADSTTFCGHSDWDGPRPRGVAAAPAASCATTCGRQSGDGIKDRNVVVTVVAVTFVAVTAMAQLRCH